MFSFLLATFAFCKDGCEFSGTTVTITSKKTSLPRCWGYSDKVETVIIGPEVEVISHSYFALSSSLKKVIFEGESSLKSIEQEAFSSCKSLTEFIIPKTVTFIDYSSIEVWAS